MRDPQHLKHGALIVFDNVECRTLTNEPLLTTKSAPRTPKDV